MDNCSRHKKDVAGISDMKELAERIGDLHYETLAELLANLATKIDNDARHDFQNGRKELATALEDAAFSIGDALINIRKAWQISKPFMEENPQTENKWKQEQ